MESSITFSLSLSEGFEGNLRESSEGNRREGSARQISQDIWKEMAEQRKLQRAAARASTDETSAEEKAPAPKPVEPTPKPLEPTPKPLEPTPKPLEPTPKPVEPAPKPKPEGDSNQNGVRTSISASGAKIEEVWANGKLERSTETAKDGHVRMKEYDADGKINHTVDSDRDKSGVGKIVEQKYKNGGLLVTQVTEIDATGAAHGKIYAPDGKLANTIETRGDHSTIFAADGKTRMRSITVSQDKASVVLADFAPDGKTIARLSRLSSSPAGGQQSEVLLDPNVFDVEGKRKVEQSPKPGHSQGGSVKF